MRESEREKEKGRVGGPEGDQEGGIKGIERDRGSRPSGKVAITYFGGRSKRVNSFPAGLRRTSERGGLRRPVKVPVRSTKPDIPRYVGSRQMLPLGIADYRCSRPRPPLREQIEISAIT